MITEHINFPATAPRQSEREKAQLRQQIAEQTAEFERAGGQVKALEFDPEREGPEERTWSWADVRKGGRRMAV